MKFYKYCIYEISDNDSSRVTINKDIHFHTTCFNYLMKKSILKVVMVFMNIDKEKMK
jgi:hypothetical protein